MYSTNKSELQQLREDNARLLNRIEVLKRDLKDLENIREELLEVQEENRNLHSEVKELKSDLQDTKEQISDLEEENERLQKFEDYQKLIPENIEQEMMIEKLVENWDNLRLSDIEAICKI